jgi:hypothetical protein
MSIRFQFGTLALALTLGLTAIGCEQPSASDDESNRSQAGGEYWGGKFPNGTGVHIGTTKPLSQWGFSTSYGWFYTTGFTNSVPNVLVNGGYFDGVNYNPGTGKILTAERSGISYSVREISAEDGQLRVVVIDPSTFATVDLSGDKLIDLRLHVQLPPPFKGADLRTYSLIFHGVKELDSNTKDVFGYELTTQIDNSPGAKEVAFCQRNDLGTNEMAQFTGGSQWNPMTAKRTDAKALTSVSCESGAIGRCAQWGYRPWAKAANKATGTSEYLPDAHQACIYMKRADYCGNGDTYTVDGTMIGISDVFDPAFQATGGGKLEALWTPKGALCLGIQRHADMPIAPACAVTLPACSSSATWSGYYMESSLTE